MSVIFRASDVLMADVRSDLSRPHPFAYERVGFVSVRAASAGEHVLLLAENYYPVSDEDYVRDDSVGAMMSREAIRKALEIALLRPVGMFHVHMHLLGQRLWFSPVDMREQLRFVPDFFKVRADMPHGALVLSPQMMAGRVWLSPQRVQRIDEFNSTGSRMRTWRAAADGSTEFSYE